MMNALKIAALSALACSSVLAAPPVTDSVEPIVPVVIQVDIDGDQLVTSLDLLHFLSIWSLCKASADVNHDGQIDSQDFFDYYIAYVYATEMLAAATAPSAVAE